MRGVMKVVGLGTRKQGVSKNTGKEYDFLPVSFIFSDAYTTGYKAATCNVSGDIVDGVGGLKIDGEYDFVFHDQKFHTVIDAIL